MAWELANEPRPGTGDSGIKNLEHFYNWIDETADFIHSIDPNHLVTTGNEGTFGCLNNAKYFVAAHQSENIDYVTFHMWAKNWSWFDATDAENTYPATKDNALKYFNEHMLLARKLNKPKDII